MPKPPPRSLCLPDIVADPQARADHVAANPPRHGPSHSRIPSIISDTSPVPPSPTSTNSHRASAATLSSLASPLATASTRTSLSVHNLSWGNDNKRGSLAKVANDAKGWSFASLIDASSDKTSSSWSNTFSGSWFGGPSATSEPSSKSPNPKEIKLSPSMIAAVASEEITPKSAGRPMSYPLTAQRKPRVGTGLQYYTERNPAPPNSRFQISESESPSSSLAPPTPVPMTGSGRASLPNTTPIRSPLEKDSALPDIRVSSG